MHTYCVLMLCWGPKRFQVWQDLRPMLQGTHRSSSHAIEGSYLTTDHNTRNKPFLLAGPRLGPVGCSL